MGDGTGHERTLARTLATEDWSVMRSPSSGGGTQRRQPDLLTSQRDHRALAIELKSGANKRLYLSSEEARGLCAFASDFGAIPLAVFRWTGDTRYYPIRVPKLPTTDGGSFVGDHETAQQEGWHDGGLPNAVLGIESADAEAHAEARR